MTTTLTKPECLSSSELEDFGIDIPRDFAEAWRIDDDTINLIVYAPELADALAPPNEDDSGEDAWEWIEFRNGYERDQWIEDNDDWDDGNNVWIERYEHSMVRYAPIGESSRVDRQWDVAQGVAVIRFLKPDIFGSPVLEVARAICGEYTDWCNGSVYGIITWRRQLPVEAPHCPVLIPDEFAAETWHEEGSCWGFIGSSCVTETAKTGAF